MVPPLPFAPAGEIAAVPDELLWVRVEGARVRVLGVDPGLTRCGLGVVDGRDQQRVVVDLGLHVLS